MDHKFLPMKFELNSSNGRAKFIKNNPPNKLQTRWIGRAGPTAWPPRSPDLTPCGFFLWGYVKVYVFREFPTTITELKAKIRDAISSISEDTLKNVVKNTEFRIRYLIRQNGAHFENLLN